jgi:DNA mismatch repair ATPase MutL
MSNSSWSRRLDDEGRVAVLVVVHEPRLLSSMRWLRAALESSCATPQGAGAPRAQSWEQLITPAAAPASHAGAVPTNNAGYTSLLTDHLHQGPACAAAAKVRTSLLRAQGIVRHVPSDAGRPARAPVRTMASLQRYKGSSAPESAAALRQHMPPLSVGEWTSRSVCALAAIAPDDKAAEVRWRAIMAASTVVGVWDKKCVLLTTPDHQLYLCDQHAIHERTRLEYFVRNAASYLSPCPCTAPYNAVPSSHSHDCQRLLAPLQSLGWRFSAPAQSAPQLLVLSHPRVVVEGFVYEIEGVAALTSTIEELCDVGGASDVGGATVDVIPSAILQILISRSCRGAVMFGDALSLADAALLVRSATRCVRKFLECSHGRPSFAACDFMATHTLRDS